MMKKLLTLSLAATLLLSACNASSENTEDPNTRSEVETVELEIIQIGVVAPFSGDAAVYGEEIRYAYTEALIDANEMAAAQGVEFELVYEDGLCDATSASTAFQKLTEVDGIQYVLGGTCSSETLAITNLAEDNGVIAISPLSSNPEIEGASPNVFSLSYSDSGNGQKVAELLSDYTKVAMLTEQHDYSNGFRDVVLAELEGTTTEVILDLEFSEGATDLRNELQQLYSSDVEAIFFNPAPGASSTAMAKQMLELGEWNIYKVSQLVLANEENMALDPVLMNGIQIVDAPTVKSPAYLALNAAITANGGGTPNIGSYYTAATYDALMIMTELILNNDGDVEAMKTNLSTGTFSGLLGNDLSFNGNSFVEGVGVALFEIRDNELVEL
jgi:ABC-type branched-subunit amino acid transport system substrate-binding protein